jgi:Ni2+-binding GTPase involved in maturation of urease and hydrogenase
MPRVKMILVGGFLGAGKTTLLARAAEELSTRGRRVGLITNDQAANLVDTEVLRQAGREVKEVSGACFCCAFNKLLYVCENLIDLHHPDVILAEPVGSCTDLSATVLQPLKKLCADRFDLAPYSVLVDPGKLSESLAEGQAHDIGAAVRYIYRKQIEEADLVIVNKIDMLAAERLGQIIAAIRQVRPGTPIITMSALDRTGVSAWLDRVMAGGPSGQRIVEVDYDTYAAGEAALGWLNAAIELSGGQPTDWKAMALSFLDKLQLQLKQKGNEIAHLKMLVTTPGGRLQANVTSSSAEPMVQGDLPAPSMHATLVVNARVRTSPEELKRAVENCLAQAAGGEITVNIAEISSLRPGRPVPVHRFGEVV